MPMTTQTARIRGLHVGNRGFAIRGNHIKVEIHHPLSGNRRHLGVHAVGRVADRAGKSSVDVASVLAETRIPHDVGQVVTLSAKGIVTSRSQIGREIQVHDRPTRRGRLAHIIAALQNMRVLRAVRAVRPGAAEFPVIIAVMAIGAQNAGAHAAALRAAIQIQHVWPEAGLRE